MIKDLLGVPPEMEVYDMMILGYPALKPPKKFLRNLDEMVHWDKSSEGDFRTEEQIRTFTKKARNWTIGTHSRSAE